MGALSVFAAMMDDRSFHKTAAVLHRTQPRVAKVIAGLEDTLGVCLVNRLTHSVEPTLPAPGFAPRVAGGFGMCGIRLRGPIAPCRGGRSSPSMRLSFGARKDDRGRRSDLDTPERVAVPKDRQARIHPELLLWGKRFIVPLLLAVRKLIS